ncbi:DUF3298 and DUF4163 domain-containing protein [Rhizobium mongolense]|uniref:DUF3298 domain-containing protein n=1 Tax=Rhizobium mongolense TaxID=57676 RepID=A0A7W6WCG0_9HYPH|nr:DUF3298 and DUF4163 domain-containing protein [Rhizobium mongolense]MBB4272961.1 hypothetical protein [Rhizobium mongolense]
MIEEKEQLFELSVEYIDYKKPDTYWRMINSHIESTALAHYFSFKADIPKLELDPSSEYFRPVEFQLKTEEFYCRGEFVSLQYYVYFDMGGAHGNYRTLTSNFFGSRHGKISIQDLLGNDDEKAAKLLSYCLKVVEAGLDEPEPVDWMVELNDTPAVWSVLANFNFDNRGLTFNFSPYDILYYAAGSYEVNMPWQIASNYLTKEYLEPWRKSEL